MLEDFGTGKGFRCRGKEVNRIEAFSDAVFGFALTLLVISSEGSAHVSRVEGGDAGVSGVRALFRVVIEHLVSAL